MKHKDQVVIAVLHTRKEQKGPSVKNHLYRHLSFMLRESSINENKRVAQSHKCVPCACAVVKLSSLSVQYFSWIFKEGAKPRQTRRDFNVTA